MTVAQLNDIPETHGLQQRIILPWRSAITPTKCADDQSQYQQAAHKGQYINLKTD